MFDHLFHGAILLELPVLIAIVAIFEVGAAVCIRAEIGGSIVRFRMMTSYSTVPWTNECSFYAYCTDMLEFADNYALTH